MVGNHKGHNFSIENVFLKSIFIPIFDEFLEKLVKKSSFLEKIDDWVVRPRVAMVTKMKKLTRIFKSLKSMICIGIEMNYQKGN